MKRALYRLLIVAAAFMTVVGSAGPTVLAQTPVASPSASPIASPIAETESPHGIQVADMDLGVDPGDDFYQFANGGWAARTQIPPDQPAYGAADEVSELVDQQLFGLLADLEPDATTPQGKVRTVFDQALDADARNEAGIDPLRPILDTIRSISTIEEGLTYQEGALNDNMFGLFIPYGDASPVDATTNIAWLYGPFLSLPSEDYYLDDSEDSQAIRDAWVSTTAQMLVQIGYSEDEAATAAQTVLDFQTALAGAKTPDADLYSDPNALNNPRTIDELKAILPSFDWDAFLEQNGIADVEMMNVADIAYLEALGDLLDTADPLTLQYMFAAELVWGFSSYLTTDIEAVAFSFTGPVLYGVDVQQPANERALGLVESIFPEAVGQAYVAEAFSPEAKAQVELLVDNLIAAYRIRIEESTWMSDETKLKAQEKLDLMSVKVGYPDSWKTYDAAEIGDSLFASVESAYDVANRENLDKIGQPVDRTEWNMGVYEVNAYYNPSLNEIVFPAAILQAPFFDPEADLASNYGSIGAVIGHEITHGFDLSGSQFDGYGNLVSWWSDEDYAKFSALNDEVAVQYSQIEILPGVMVDGEITVTENVADMGGLQVAYDAMLIALATEQDHDHPWFLTQQQRFFIAYARCWRQQANPEFLQVQIASDVHAPDTARAVEPARNMDEFYEAFDIDAGDPEYLAPEDRVVIW